MDNSKYLISVIGPTATGKSRLAVKLAEYYSTEIISADSRQFYRKMNIGTAKPSNKELMSVKHHFIDNLDPEEAYSASRFEKEAIPLINSLMKKYTCIIVVGGSGLYLKAVWEGMDVMPSVSKNIRSKVIQDYEQKGLEFLREELRTTDPRYFRQADSQNPRRVMRAIEVIRATGTPYSKLRKGSKQKRSFENIKIGLKLPRQELYKKINERVDRMVQGGLIEEVKNLAGYKRKNALETVGYKEIFEYLDGKYDKKEAIRRIKRNTRRYAKRQMTWFKKDPNINWYHPDEETRILQDINSYIKEGGRT